MTEPPALGPNPYGHQAPPMSAPAFNPGAAKAPGSTACKVWGVILLVLAAYGAINMVAGIAMIFGGFTGSEFNPTLSQEAREQMDQLSRAMTESSLARPSFYISTIAEVLIVALSALAGFWLVVRPNPRGAKLALARAAIALLTLPLYGYEMTRAMESVTELQTSVMRVQFEEQRKAHGQHGPSVDEMMDFMDPIMKGVVYGSLGLVVVGVLVVNVLLGFHMSRPKMREYLESAQLDQRHVIPNYDPSMGLLMHPPGQQPPGNA